MKYTTYDAMPYRCRELAAWAVRRHGAAGQRKINPSNLHTVAPRTSLRCVRVLMREVRLVAGRASAQQAHDLLLTEGFLVAALGCSGRECA